MRLDGKTFDEERALYGLTEDSVVNCRFAGPADGESALKECRDLTVEHCFFDLRYPFWHVSGAVIRNCELTSGCRAALWYDADVTIEDSKLGGIKALRECDRVTLRRNQIVSPEFLWRCRGVTMEDCTLESEYPLFECSNVDIRGLTMKGKYSFQYMENAQLRNCVLDTKDAFWHSKNVTVYDSVVKGEYLGWYSENLRLVRCQIIGTQPLCYCKGLVLEDCTMEGTDLAFERSQVNAAVLGRIESVKNPAEGSILADSYGEVIMEPAFTHPERVNIAIRKEHSHE